MIRPIAVAATVFLAISFPVVCMADGAVATTLVTTPPGPWTLALNNLLTGVLTAGSATVAAAIVAVATKLWAKFGVEGVTLDQANMEKQTQSALSFAITEVLPVIEAKGWNSPEVKSMVLDKATAYFRQRFPDRSAMIAASAGVDPKSNAAAPAVSDTLSARLPEAMKVAADSPATPPVPPPVISPVVIPTSIQQTGTAA